MPSRVCICAGVQTIAVAISGVTANSGSLYVSVARMCKTVNRSFVVDARNFKKFRSISREMTANCLVLLETDKSSRFQILPQVNGALLSLFKPFSGDLEQIKSEPIYILHAAKLSNTVGTLGFWG